MTDPISGKTKWIQRTGGQSGRVHSKDELSANNKLRQDTLPGKGAIANATTCNVFDLLQAMGVPLAYLGRDGDTFLTEILDMIPVEVVVRNEAAGSYCRRNPQVEPGTVFDEPVVEFFYKTNDEQCLGESIGVDDPFMMFNEQGDTLWLFHPDKPTDEKSHLLTVQDKHMGYDARRQLFAQLKVCKVLALDATCFLTTAWKKQDGRLVDVKYEFGVDQYGTIKLGDVVDSDSWRVIWKGGQLSKQPYRDGCDPSDLLQPYRIAEQLTGNFMPLE